MALVLTLRFNEVMKIGDTLIKLEKTKSSTQVKVHIDAPREIRVDRLKVFTDDLAKVRDDFDLNRNLVSHPVVK